MSSTRDASQKTTSAFAGSPRAIFHAQKTSASINKPLRKVYAPKPNVAASLKAISLPDL
jgi:hypothetical protein